MRQALDKVSTRKGKPRYERDGRLIAYTNLTPKATRTADSGLWARRTFYLLPELKVSARAGRPHCLPSGGPPCPPPVTSRAQRRGSQSACVSPPLRGHVVPTRKPLRSGPL
ncbi:DUF6009 family protein [Streptomyces sp. NBC_01361]|uniref:DUF6009 family protein n=1 Tax=Streptomyces sp. NBC_01361 TaxID=2903838 RepID=UPI003FCDB6A5